MARKSVDYIVLNNVDISTNQTGFDLAVQDMDLAGVVVQWSGGSGATAGYLIAEVRNGESAWTPLTLSTTPVVAGVSGNLLINISQFCFKRLRISYVRTGGGGNLTATVYAKSIGA